LTAGVALTCVVLLNMIAPGRALANKNLSITVVGAGSVSSSPSGINGCTSSGASNCTAAFTNNATIVLTATPNPGSIFVSWTKTSGNAILAADCSGASGTCTISDLNNSDTSITATFASATPTRTPTITATSTPTSTPTVTSTPTSTP